MSDIGLVWCVYKEVGGGAKLGLVEWGSQHCQLGGCSVHNLCDVGTVALLPCETAAHELL
eukprot:1142771-Amphidinium_carterae.1